MGGNQEEMHPVPKALTFIIAGFFVIYGLWATVIAFIGGTLPIVGISLRDGLGTGLFWLFIVEPILMTVG